MTDIRRLLDIMASLRDPHSGCPWDLQQDFRTLVPYTLEEVYEVVDAIEQDDPRQLREELGDLLFQIVFYARIAEERGWFDMADVTETIATKLMVRHPHVFAVTGERQAPEMEALHHAWEQRKRQERAEKGVHGLLGDVPLALPALQRAHKIQGRLARAGFDWDNSRDVLQQLRAELDELEMALASGDVAACEDELGDVLFSSVNLARHLRIDAETALRGSNAKVSARVAWMENALRERGMQWQDQSLVELDALWQTAKQALSSRS